MANGDDRKAKLPEGYVLDQEWESGEGPTAAATTAAGQSTPPGARDTAGDLGKLGAISRTVGDTVRGAVTPSKPQGKTASEEAGEAIRRGWRALITPPPPRLPPQGPARETMSAQPTFWQGVENLAGQGPGQMESRAPAYENMTPEGRAEHPILSRVGDVTRGTKQYGGMLLNLGGLLAGPEYEEFPNAAPRPAARAPGSQMPAVPRTTLRDIGNVLENEMNRPPLPRIEPQFDKVAHDLFGKPYEELNGAQKRDVAMRAVRAPTERGTIQPVERRRPGGAPMGAPPGGVERRLPWVQQTFGAGAPGAESDIELELRGGPAPLAPVGEVGTVKPRTWTPPSTKGGVVIRGGKVVPEEGAPPPSAAGTTELPPSRRETILPERKPAPFTLETEPSTGIRYAKSEGIPHVTVPTRLIDPREIEAYVREKQALQPPEKKPPPQPGTPERPPPTTEEDPLKREFPDPAVRRFARANGPEVVRATEGDPEALEAIHNLTNVEVRQAAINLGMDVGTKHVGQKIGLGPEQVSRQELIGEMMRRGINPRQLPELARPQTTEFAANELKQGDTFVDDKGEPRRVVEIKDGKIETADGTTRSYEGSIDSQTDLNSPKAQLARGGKFIEGKATLVPGEKFAQGAELHRVEENLKKRGVEVRDTDIGHWILPNGKGVAPTSRRGISNHWEAAVDAGYLPESELEHLTHNPLQIVNGLLKKDWVRWTGHGGYEIWTPNDTNVRVLENRLRWERHPTIYVDDAEAGVSYEFPLQQFKDNDFNLRETLKRAERREFEPHGAIDLKFQRRFIEPIPIQDLKFPKPEGAATGKPIEFDAYRATTEPEFRPNPGRGTFFSPEATSEFGEHIFSARVRFKNPLVVTDGIEAAKILNRPVLARRYENLLSGMNETGETPLGVGAPGSDPFQKADADLARHARAAGYDGIIFSEHDDLNPTQYMAIGPKTVSNVQKIGKFNWKNATVEKQ